MFLANENFPKKSIDLLRENDVDIKSIGETSPGISDNKVLTIAQKEQRTILTFDKDYGYLIYKKNIAFSAGLIYFRFVPERPESVGQLLMKLIYSNVVFKGYFTVIHSGSIRQKPLPLLR